MEEHENKLDKSEFVGSLEEMFGIKLHLHQKILLKLLLSNSPVGNLIEKNFYKRY